jgi:hypothetical protein
MTGEIDLGKRDQEKQRRFGRRTFLKIAAGAGVTATAAAGTGAILPRVLNMGEGPKAGGGLPTLEPTATPTPEPTPTATPEPTPTPEVKSTPYNIVNKRIYLDGQLTLGIVDGLQTRTKVPKSIYPGDPEGDEEVEATASSGFEINPNMEGAARNVTDMISAGLLLAWSSQTNIPENQRNLVTTLDEGREIHMAKWAELKRRAKEGEKFEVTLRAYKNEWFVEKDVTIDIGEDYRYEINQLVKPPVQIIWHAASGSGIRLSPENKVFRIEFYSQYAGALGLWSEKIYLSSMLIDIMAYLPELVVSEGKKLRPDYNRPRLDYLTNVYRDKALTLARMYSIIPDAYPGTYGKDWKDGAIYPLP